MLSPWKESLEFRVERARRERVGALTICTDIILAKCDGKLSTRPDRSQVKSHSIQYNRTELCVGVVLDNIPVDRRVCGSTGGENNTIITDRASIACVTIKLAGSIQDKAASCQESIDHKIGDNSTYKTKEVENGSVPEGTHMRDPLLRPSSVRAVNGNITFSSPISKKITYKQKSVADISSIFGGCGGKEALRSANRKYPHLNAKPSQPMFCI